MSHPPSQIAARLLLVSVLAGCSGDVVPPGDASRDTTEPAARVSADELELSVGRDVDPLDVEVRIRQPAWTAECNGRTTRNELHIPVGRRIRVWIHSDEPIAFTIPAFRVRRSVAPEGPSQVWFEAFVPGVYPVVLVHDEEQGGRQLEHREAGTVTVMTADEFERAVRGGVSVVVWILLALHVLVVGMGLEVRAWRRAEAELDLYLAEEDPSKPPVAPEPPGASAGDADVAPRREP